MQSQRSFLLNTKALEVADGKDGFLRGRPDPAVILAAYAVHGTDTHCVGRSIFRFVPNRSMPCTVAPKEGSPISKQLTFRDSLDYVIIAASVEENSGDGIRAAYAAFEYHRALSLWSLEDSHPSPMQLSEISSEKKGWLAPVRAGLLVEGNDVAKTFTDDAWVGAVAWCIPGEHSGVLEYRLPFRSNSSVNNWTAICEARIQ